MPRFDGTGPVGNGSMTGRGMGVCNNLNVNSNFGFRRGLGCGQGFRRFPNMGYGRGLGLGYSQFANSTSTKSMLENHLNSLKAQVSSVEKQLESFESEE